MPDLTEGERAKADASFIEVDASFIEADAPFIEADAPFLVEHRQEDASPGGTFRPAARLVLSPALRTGGLWHALAPEDLKNLLLLLTFLTPNGWCRPTLPELGAAMQASQGKARARMMRLTETDWRGQPLVTVLTRPDGLDAFLPGRHLLAHEEAPDPQESPAPAPYRAAGREAVIAHSRAAYARKRGEVESEIAERMGWGPPVVEGEDADTAERRRRAFGRMTALGVSREQALSLLARFGLERVERQLEWIGHRNAKSPDRFLVAAVEGDYEAPPALRRQAPAGSVPGMTSETMPGMTPGATGEGAGPESSRLKDGVVNQEAGAVSLEAGAVSLEAGAVNQEETGDADLPPFTRIPL